MALASHLVRRFNLTLFDRVCGGTKREWLAGIVHRIVSGQESGVQPNHHLLCIDALFGEQRLFFDQLRLVQTGQTTFGQSSSDVGRDKGGSALVHKEIFLLELQRSGRDVMLHLNDRFPLTHEWILKNALAWSRQKIAKLVPQGPERESTLRAAARERQSEEAAVRDRRRRAMSAIGGVPTQAIAPSNDREASEHAFHELADKLSTFRNSHSS